MLKGEIYAVFALLCFGLSLFILNHIGMPWGPCIIVSLAPAVYFARKAAISAERISNK